MSQSDSSTVYKTPSLTSRLSADALSAICTSTLVAPLICLIDKSIILKTHSTDSISTIFASNLKTALRRPLAFLVSTPFILINTLYFATYTTANVTDTVTAVMNNKPASTVTGGPAKFLATSTTNLSLCMYKDARFTKMFGAAAKSAGKSAGAAAARTVPRASLALFAARDSMTMFASFNVPPVLGPLIGSTAVAQFVAPASVQFLSTPLHLLGLDLYNRPRGQAGVSWGMRWAIVKRDWLGASFARLGRIVPAYGLGGVVNAGMRRRLMKSLE